MASSGSFTTRVAAGKRLKMGACTRARTNLLVARMRRRVMSRYSPWVVGGLIAAAVGTTPALAQTACDQPPILKLCDVSILIVGARACLDEVTIVQTPVATTAVSVTPTTVKP